MDEYKVITRFECGGNKMILIRDAKSACVVTQEEWCWIESNVNTKRKNKRIA